jgi:hypothetical protein
MTERARQWLIILYVLLVRKIFPPLKIDAFTHKLLPALNVAQRYSGWMHRGKH